MLSNEIRDFIFANYYERNGFSDKAYYSMKYFKKIFIDKINALHDAKVHYQQFLRKKKQRTSKTVKEK